MPRSLEAALAVQGFNLTGSVPSELYDSIVPAAWRSSEVAPGTRSVLIAGHAGREVWKCFRAAPEACLRRDPFERADHNSNTYWDWMIDKAPQGYLGLAKTAEFLQTFKEYPPSQTPDSWSIDRLTERLLGVK